MNDPKSLSAVIAEPRPPESIAPAPGVSVPVPHESLNDAIARSRAPRVVPTLHVVDIAPRVEHFASTAAPQSEKLSILDPRYRARPEPVALPPSLPLGAPSELSPAQVEAMRARERRSILDPESLEKAPGSVLGAPLSVPVHVADPCPIRFDAAPRAQLAARPIFHGQSRPAEVPPAAPPALPEAPRGTPALYSKEPDRR